VAWHLSDIGHWFESFFIPAIVYWAIDRKTGVFCNLAIFGTGENKETE
jgi:hypothetical protein